MHIQNTLHQLFPDDCYVSHEQVIGWAHDRMVDACVDDYVKLHGLIPDDALGAALYERLALSVVRPDIDSARAFLEDLGLHTFAGECDLGVSVNRMSDVLRPMVRRCWPKEQHASAGAAEAQKRSLLKRGLEKDAARIRVYECHFCGTFHVGHR